MRKLLVFHAFLAICLLGHASPAHSATTGPTIFSTFPDFTRLPQTITAAQSSGFTTRIKSCGNKQDRTGNLVSRTGKDYFLPALMYNNAGILCGVVFAVDKSTLLFDDETNAPFQYQNFRGQIYWFRSPQSVCSNGQGRSVQTRLWTKLRAGRKIMKIPMNVERLSPRGETSNKEWTEHLCLVGMGTHYVYGSCGSSFQNVVLYSEDKKLVGVVHGISLKLALDPVPVLMETIPALALDGLVFNETRFDPCFDESRPAARVFVHMYFGLPEQDFQSCKSGSLVSPAGLTAQKKRIRCILCARTILSVCEKVNGGVGNGYCACLENKYLADGGCVSQGCTWTPSAEVNAAVPFDFMTCE